MEDGTGLVRVILWRKEKECTEQHRLIDKCNSNHYILVIGELEDYYGVHEIIAFDVRPVSLDGMCRMSACRPEVQNVRHEMLGPTCRRHGAKTCRRGYRHDTPKCRLW